MNRTSDIINAGVLIGVLGCMTAFDGFAAVSFLAPVKYATGDQPRLRVATDLSGDGMVDFAMTDRLSATVSVLINQGDGTFVSAQYAVGANPADVITCDVNGDGKTDLVSSDYNANALSVLLNNGDGTFALPYSVVTGSGPLQARCLYSASGNPTIHFLQVINRTDGKLQQFTDDGFGNFTLQLTEPTGSLPNWLTLYDANADGIADPIVANSDSNTVSVSLRVLSAGFATTAYAVGAYPVYVEGAKLSSDNYVDLASANANDGSISILINKGDGTGTFESAVSYGACPDARAFVFGDFNSDDRVDIAVRCLASERVAIFLNAGNGVFLPAVVYALGGTPRTINTADFDGDGKRDLVFGLGSANAVAVLFGNGDGTFQSPILIPVGLDPGASVQVRDVDGDSRPDITVALRGESAIAVLRNGGSFPAGGTVFIGGTGVGSGNAAIAVEGGGPTCAFSHAAFVPVSGGSGSPPFPPPVEVHFPQGLVDFAVGGCASGGTITVRMSFPQPLPLGAIFWKFGPTRSNTAPHWYVIPATIVANVVTFMITDGGLGDDDLTVNGVIVDQGGPGLSPAPPVPMVSNSVIALLTMMLALIGVGGIRLRS